jgi:hypothetical protein
MDEASIFVEEEMILSSDLLVIVFSVLPQNLLKPLLFFEVNQMQELSVSSQ